MPLAFIGNASLPRQASVGAAAVLSQKYLHNQNDQRLSVDDPKLRATSIPLWGTARSKGNVRMTGWQALHRDRLGTSHAMFSDFPYCSMCKIGLSLNIATSATWTKALKCLTSKQCTSSKRSFQQCFPCPEAATIPVFVFAKQWLQHKTSPSTSGQRYSGLWSPRWFDLIFSTFSANFQQDPVVFSALGPRPERPSQKGRSKPLRGKPCKLQKLSWPNLD